MSLESLSLILKGHPAPAPPPAEVGIAILTSGSTNVVPFNAVHERTRGSLRRRSVVQTHHAGH
jgi:hypothetical protein